ncbi:Transcription elongation factor spt6 [Chytriomyces hyalinus]|nr:Transcription elongation factor spt6 [Chytriomyces hyalinus]
MSDESDLDMDFDEEKREKEDDDDNKDSNQAEQNGDNGSKKKSSRRVAADSDDSSVEDSDEEMTEADKKFIVDDEEVSDNNEDDEDEDEDLDAKRRAREQRKLLKRKQREEEEDLDEDDMDLINENYGRSSGRKKGGRLKLKKLNRVVDDDSDGAAASQSRKAGQGSRSRLDDMFEEDETPVDDDREGAAKSGKADRRAPAYDSDDEESDDGFVVDDDEGQEDREDETDRDREERRQRQKEERKKERQFTRNLGQQYGISDDVWHEINDLFGDGSDYDYALIQRDMSKVRLDAVDLDNEDDDYETESKKPVKLTDIYEPSEIAERMLTDEDEVIRLKDVPERFQLCPEFPPQSEEDLAREVTHIESSLLAAITDRSHPFTQASPTSRQSAITKVLKFFHGEDKFEVPFIALHRKDHITLVDRDAQFVGTLDRVTLWKIWDLDIAYGALEVKRKACRNLITEMRTSPELLGSSAVQSVLLNDSYIDDMLRTAKSLEDVADVMAYLQLYYSEEIRKVEESKGRRREQKRAMRRSEYAEAKRLGIGEFVKLFGVDVKTFSESISLMRALHSPEDLLEEPLDTAMKFVVEKSAFSNEQKVIEAARMMLAHQISVDPTFRRFLRKVYADDAVVTVTPTERGKREITPLHPYYPFKYLKEKPAHKLIEVDRMQYLQIHKAETEGLVTVRVFVEEEANLLEDIVRNITNDFSSELAERWNDERRRCAEKATKEIIFPTVVKWFKETMAAKAAEVLMDECRAALEKKLDVQPFRRDTSQDEFEDEEEANRSHARVMALSWGEGDPKEAAFAICIDEHGRVCKTAKLSQLHMRDTKRQDHDAILAILREFRVEVIVMGGFTLSTKTRLLPDIVDSLERIYDDTSDRRSSRRRDIIKPSLIMVEDDVARLSMNSKRYVKEFPDYPPLARYCISLARRVQDTLLEFASLYNADFEIGLLSIHPLQRLLPDDKLKIALERAIINTVNQNGVDINDAASLPHRSGTLQFVSGLGPRKAGFIINRINKTGGKLESRSELITKKMVGRVIFMNAASFIKIHRRHFKRTNTILDVLDNTRIHPEDYDIARKMAAGAMDLDENAFDPDDPSGHILELMDDHPERLNNLMLDDFAEELFRTSQDLKRLTLRDIKDEIIQPYHDFRARLTMTDVEKIFTMLTGETEESLLGMCVSCQLVKVFDRFYKCRLTSSGLDANLQLNAAPVSNDNRLKENDTFQAVVTRIEMKEFKVELDAREETVASGKWLNDLSIKLRDKQFDVGLEMDDKEKKTVQPKVVPKQKRTRTINHPFWKNCSYEEAISELTGPSVRSGSLIIRPSTKGNDHICITWKVDEGVFQHIDILETNKDNEWTLGKTLMIEGKKFDDLEEIVAMYVEPMAQHFADARKHVKFQSGSLDDTFRFVDREMRSKKRSSYAIINCPNKPQCMYLVFQHVDKSNARHEYITIVPDGFKFRNMVYKSLDKLFDAFKKQEAARMKDAAATAAKARAAAAQSQQRAQGGGGANPAYFARPQAPVAAGGGGGPPGMRSGPGMSQYPGATGGLPQRPMGASYSMPQGMPYGQQQQQMQPPPGMGGWNSGPGAPMMRPNMPSQMGLPVRPSPLPQQQQQHQQQGQMGYRQQPGPPSNGYYGR